MAERRISVIANGKIQPPLYPRPIISTAKTAWQVIEFHVEEDVIGVLGVGLRLPQRK